MKLSRQTVLGAVLLLFLSPLLSGCPRQIPVDPVQLPVFEQGAGNLRLVFTTEHGRQVAYYLPPRREPERPPERLCLLYPGISAQALGWLRFIKPEEAPATGWLLIDYPGRGECEGIMNPEDNYLNSEGALTALAEHFGHERLAGELDLLGHSFGSGAALQFATRRSVARIVLVAPFDTLRRAVARTSRLLALIIPIQIDNRQLIRQLLKELEPPEITILHGSRDRTLPVAMGRELAAIESDKIVYHEYPEDDHVSILTSRRDLIFRTLTGQDTRAASGLLP